MRFEGEKAAARAVSEYRKLSASERDILRRERLKDLVLYAKENSPYFNKLYENVGEDFRLQDLPVTNKAELMANFDDWVTDRDIKISELLKLMEDSANIGKRYLGKYSVFSTSGTTGKPGVIIYNDTAWYVLRAIHNKFLFTRMRDLICWTLHGFKSVTIYAKDAFNGTSASSRRMLGEGTIIQRRHTGIDLFEPIPRIIEQLNMIRPAAIYAYPTVLLLLTEEARAGRLKISPRLVMSIGEHLSDETRETLERTFGCFVQNTYGCTEGGAVAHECKHHRLHVHDGWIIMEPVDKDNNPTPSGSLADKWLMTALTSYAQPIIRYEIKDRVILHDEGCPCGDISPWIEIEGRVDEPFMCPGTDGDGYVGVAPAIFYEILSSSEGVKGFQLIQLKDKNFKLRLLADDKGETFEGIKPVLSKTFAHLGIRSEVFLSHEEFQLDPKSGKFRMYIIEK
jgi:phenylacetate-coenzyme A ligase PaaK-like adenylate-forming protein